MIPYLLDTNLLIGHLSGNPQAVSFVGTHHRNSVVSFVTRIELLSLKGMSHAEEQTIRSMLDGLRLLLIDDAIIEKAAEIG